MENTAIAGHWWALTLRGLLGIMLGLIAFFWPGPTLAGLVIFFGVYALVDGIFALASIFTAKRGGRPWVSLFIEGLVGVAAGIAALTWPGITVLALLAVVAAWAVITGVIEIAAAIRLRAEIRNEWLLIASGVLSIILGVIAAAMPAVGIRMVLTMVGIYAFLSGIALLSASIRMRDYEVAAESRMRFGREEILPGAVHTEQSVFHPAWSGVVAGVFVSLASFFVFNLLGAAFGLSVAAEFTGEGIAIGSLVWGLVSGLAALFVGGLVAGQAVSLQARTGYACLNGILLWSMTFTAAVTLVSQSGLTTNIGALFGIPLTGNTIQLNEQGVPVGVITLLASPVTKASMWWALWGLCTSLVSSVSGVLLAKDLAGRVATRELPVRDETRRPGETRAAS